ncbi:MAG: peptide-N4-asparagine amidase [Candidatus Tumulicola sp.]
MRNYFRRMAQWSAVIALAAAGTACAGHDNGASLFPQGTSAQNAALSGPLSLSRSAQKIRGIVGRGGMHAAGSSNYPVTADPPVSHPPVTPCVDKLFNPHTPPLSTGGSNVGTFADYGDHPFNYTPPANCPGPYAKIIMKIKFSVTAGIQYDRSGAVWIGGTNVFFGTTSEPGPGMSPAWTIERDVTEYAPAFANAAPAQASVYNIVNSQYTGIIYGTAQLDFYPATKQYPAPSDVADAVYPMAASTAGGYVYLDSPTDQLTGTFSFPQNVQAAYLDVFLEPQSNDEFWYSCFPNDLAGKLGNCGNTGFREGEVSVDGQPAGVAPIYPFIFTGGFDPNLWVPIPGVNTLNFKPYRVDLTPFAGTLDDGNPHTVSVSVFNDDNYFATSGALLIYEDHGSSQVTGGLISNGTAVSPNQVVTEHVKSTPSGGAQGTIDVSATHPVSLNGYVITSKGRIQTQVTQSVSFDNHQSIVDTDSQYKQNIAQTMTLTSNVSTKTKGRAYRSYALLKWPLNVGYNYMVGQNSAKQVVSILQTRTGSGYDQQRKNAQTWQDQNTVNTTDTLTIIGQGATPSDGKSRQQYKSSNVDGSCYAKTITSVNYVLKNIIKGC